MGLIIAGALAIIGGIVGVSLIANADATAKNNKIDLNKNNETESGINISPSSNESLLDIQQGIIGNGNIPIDEDGDGNADEIPMGEQEPNQEEEKKYPIGIDGTTNIEDTTGENEETQVNGIDYNSIFDQMRAFRDEEWAREDAIRKETQEREDTAYSRAIKDLEASGVNVNLFNVSPANSGGGITNATQINYSLYEKEMDKYMQIMEQEFQQNFKGDENSKDRYMDALKSLVSLIGIYAVYKKTRK